MKRRPYVGEWTKMLIDEHFRKCVTFLYADVNEGGVTRRTPVASAFFVGVPAIREPDGNVTAWIIYAVTARHAIDGPSSLYLRLRKADGSWTDAVVDRDVWVQHPTTDVAVAQMDGLSLELFDWRLISIEQFVTREFIQEREVGEGDEVFFSGLFVGHYGKGEPQPIIRTGSVALMPREPVRVQISKHPSTFKDIEAFLVEARSWGGQSGSPAFLVFKPDRMVGKSGMVVIGMAPIMLLGLVQGIWTDTRGETAPDPSGEGVVEINMGISAVVPAYDIAEVLMSDELIERRGQAVADLFNREGSDIAPEAVSADPETEYDRFENLAHKLVNTPKPKPDESES